MHKNYKKIAAALLTAAMIAPTTAGITPQHNASAYELLGETSFDYKMVPWHAVQASPAKQTFVLTDGAVNIRILVPEGPEKERWDLQFRHRNIDFKKGHEYKVSFKSKAERSGMELYSFIGNLNDTEEYFVLDGLTNDMHMGPHMEGQWPQSAVKLTTEWQTYEGIFKPSNDIESAQWAFQYAKGTMYSGNAKAGDEIWFDDMSIVDLTDDTTSPPVYNYGYTARGFSGLENNFISVNQLGYYQGLDKIATLGNNKGDFTYGAKYFDLDRRYDYEIVRVSDDTVVYTGKTGNPRKDSDSGDTVSVINFSEFNELGEYYIRIKDKEWRSFPFKIGTDIYSDSEHNMLTNALNYFYQNRSGIDIESKFITSGDKDKLAHAYNKDEGVGYVKKSWQELYINNIDYICSEASSKIDTSGGWLSGIDFDKSMIEGGISLWTLQNMYERASLSADGVKKFADGSGVVSVPETGNKVPDILDECRYELDFMSKLKVDPNEKTWGKYAGMYYHGMRGINFVPDPKDYIVKYSAAYSVYPPTFAATLNYAACAAQAARLWEPYDAEYAEQLLTSAKEAYEAYKKNWYEASQYEESDSVSLYEHTYYRSIGTYNDADHEVRDDAYWAACELYITAKKMQDKDADTYLAELSEYKDAFKISPRIKGTSFNNFDYSFTLFDSKNTADAGSMSLAMNMELLTDEQRTKLKDSITETAEYFINEEEAQGYGIPYKYDGSGYDDPSEIGYKVYGGFEFDSNGRALNNMFAIACAYDLTGEEKYLNGVARGMDYLLGNNPLSYSFITGYGSYSVKNPVHRLWQNEINKSLPQAPDGVVVSGPTAEIVDDYARALSLKYAEIDDPTERFYADSVESWSTNESSLTRNASLAWIVSFLQDEASTETVPQTASGDVNADGEFNISDVLLVQKWVIGDKRYTLHDWKAADFCADGRLDIFDLTHMKKEFIKNSFKDCVLPEKSLRYGNPMNVVKDGLELRLGPDESYEVINTIPAHTRIDELGYNKDNDHWMFTEYKGRYGWIRTVEEDNKTATVYPDAVAAKPVIYFYPEDETDVHVELELTEAELSTTYPKYNNGWDVTASPDGSLLNKADGTHHKYLFWDAVKCRTRFDFSEGFCIAGCDTESFLREKLTYMGLTEEEMNEFIVYWLPLMEHNKYNLISFQGDAYTDFAKLNITPKPDSLLRIFMAYVPLEEAVDTEPQQLETFERKGFTVVEWGGIEIKSQIYLKKE